MHPERFAHALSQYKNNQGAATAFSVAGSTIATDVGKLPEKVRHHYPCGDTCVREVEYGVRDLVKRTTVAMANLRHVFDCSLRELPLKQLVIAIECVYLVGTDAMRVTRFVIGILDAASSQSGPLRPTFTLFVLAGEEQDFVFCSLSIIAVVAKAIAGYHSSASLPLVFR